MKTPISSGTTGSVFMIVGVFALCIGILLAFVTLPFVGWPVVLAFVAAAGAAIVFLFSRTIGE